MRLLANCALQVTRCCRGSTVRALAPLLVLASPAAGMTSIEEKAPSSGKPNDTPTYQVGLALLKEHGTGLVARARTRTFVAQVAYAFISPVVIAFPDGVRVEYPAFHGDAGALMLLGPNGDGTQHGIQTAAIYDSLMGVGWMLGYAMERSNGSFGWSFGTGVQVYPELENVLKRRFAGFEPLDGVSSTVQPYVGFTLMWNHY